MKAHFGEASLGVLMLVSFFQELFCLYSPKPALEVLQTGTCTIGRNEKQSKEKVFGLDIPRTSRGHSCGRPGSKTSGRPSKPLKNKHLGADVHDPNTRTSMTPAGAKQKIGQKNFGLLFRFLHWQQNHYSLQAVLGQSIVDCSYSIGLRPE